jgi:hypothetical protein
LPKTSTRSLLRCRDELTLQLSRCFDHDASGQRQAPRIRPTSVK